MILVPPEGKGFVPGNLEFAALYLVFAFIRMILIARVTPH